MNYLLQNNLLQKQKLIEKLKTKKKIDNFIMNF